MAYTHKLSIRFQFLIDISVFFKNNASKFLFIKSRFKKINDFVEKDAFKVISISNISIKIRIFISHFMDEIKNEKTAIAFEKSRLIV